jgi:hypothetical protein
MSEVGDKCLPNPPARKKNAELEISNTHFSETTSPIINPKTSLRLKNKQAIF